MEIGHLVIEHSDDLIIGISTTGRIIEFNTAAETTLRIKKSEVLDRNLFTVCSDHKIKLPFDFIQLEKSAKDQKKFIDGVICSDTDQHAVRWKSVFHRGKRDSYFLIIMRYIPQLENYQDKDIKKQIYLKDILENLPEHIYWKDQNLVYQGCNKRVAEYLGLQSPMDIIGKTDYSFGWDEERIQTLHKIDKQILKTGETFVDEDIIPKPDGTQRIMLTSKSPLHSKTNRIIGILGISVDITKMKNLEEKLRKTEASEARFKAMSTLGGMIAHELRTPLTGLGMGALAIQQLLPLLIQGYEQSVSSGTVTPIRKDRLEALKKSAANMERSVKYAQAIITTILTEFHYGNVDVQIEVAPFRLKHMVEQAVAEHPFDPQEEQLCRIKHIDDVEVLGEELVMTHVLHNLLKNALHMINAEGRGEIIIWSELKQETVDLYVEDTAKGIASEELPHIFEPFYTTKRKTAASIGLGLYFCKMVLKKMDGDITCESELGRYTRFKITLPLAKVLGYNASRS